MQNLRKFSNDFIKLIPFWLFLTLFKIGGGLHYTMMAPLGAKVFPVWLVGILVGGAAFAQLCLDIPAGYLADRFGYKNMMAVTTLFFLISGTILLLGLNQITFVVSLTISILGWQFFTPSANAYVIDQSNEHNVGKFLSAKDIFTSLGIVIASALVIFAVTWSAQLIGIVLIVVFGVGLITLGISPKDSKEHKPSTQNHRKKLPLRFFKEAWNVAHELKPASYLLMITNLTASTFYAIIWFVVPLLIATEIHNGVLGLGLGIFDFSVVILGFVLGKIVDSFNKKLLVLIGIIIFAVAGILLGMNFGFLFLLLGFIATAGDELTGLSLWAWMYSIDTHHEHYGLITGMISLFDDFGWTIGPIIAGILYTIIGPSWTIGIGGIMILINLITYVFLVHYPLPSLLKKPPAHHPIKHRHRH